jgi:hypothetical protein
MMKIFLMLLLCSGALVMQAQTVSVKDGPSEKPQKHTDQYFCGYYGKDYGLENKSRHVWIDAKYEEGSDEFEVYAQPLRGGEKLTVYTVNKEGEKWLTTDDQKVMSVCLDECENGRYLSHLGNCSGTMDFSRIAEMFEEPTEIRAYIATGHTADGSIKLAERTKMPNEQGFVMEGNSPGWYQIPVTDEKISDSDCKDVNQFKFVTSGSVAQTGTKTLYSLTRKGMFQRVAKSVPAFTPYYEITGGAKSAPAMLLLDFDSATTGIDDAVIADSNDCKLDMNSPMYLLSGQRVKKPRQGTIVLQNGAKYMIK